MLPELAVLAAATFVSEDLACIAAGLLVAQHKLDLFSATVACILGIYIGDLLLFAAGRSFGRRAMRFPFLKRLLDQGRFERASRWIAERGLRVVMLSRFTPGLRLPTYFAAGVLRTSFWRFSAYLLLAASLWTPLLVASTGVLGRSAPAGLLGAAAAALAIRMAVGQVTDSHRRRRLVGWWKRVTHWEFWPWWLAYLPVFGYVAWLAVRYRSLTLFACANPGIPGGGFAGESKSDILAKLPPDFVPRFALVRSPAEVRALSFGFPVVLKPDAGERGRGVAVVRSEEELEDYFGPPLIMDRSLTVAARLFSYRATTVREWSRALSLRNSTCPASSLASSIPVIPRRNAAGSLRSRRSGSRRFAATARARWRS